MTWLAVSESKQAEYQTQIVPPHQNYGPCARYRILPRCVGCDTSTIGISSEADFQAHSIEAYGVEYSFVA